MWGGVGCEHPCLDDTAKTMLPKKRIAAPCHFLVSRGPWFRNHPWFQNHQFWFHNHAWLQNHRFWFQNHPVLVAESSLVSESFRNRVAASGRKWPLWAKSISNLKATSLKGSESANNIETDRKIFSGPSHWVAGEHQRCHLAAFANESGFALLHWKIF